LDFEQVCEHVCVEDNIMLADAVLDVCSNELAAKKYMPIKTNVLTKDVCCKVSRTQQLLSVSRTITIVEGCFAHTMHGMISQSSQPKGAEDMDFAAKRQMEKTRARTKVVITTVSNSMDLS
jgi:hypothetical protein